MGVQQDFRHKFQWRHNEREGVSNHQRLDCLLSRLLRRSSKKTSKLRVTGLCEGNSPGTDQFDAQRTSNGENVSIWWRHRESASSWWRHQMETFFALLALCAGNSPVPVISPHKGQWRGALMFSFICVWINDWVNNREAGDLRRHPGHYDVNVMYGWMWLTGSVWQPMFILGLICFCFVCRDFLFLKGGLSANTKFFTNFPNIKQTNKQIIQVLMSNGVR